MPMTKHMPERLNIRILSDAVAFRDGREAILIPEGFYRAEIVIVDSYHVAVVNDKYYIVKQKHDGLPQWRYLSPLEELALELGPTDCELR